MTTVHANGLDFAVTTAGPDDGHPVLLLHGFPELAYSWRHQITALGDAGYRVVAPDLRGYGNTTPIPREPQDYDILTLVADVTGLLDALQVDKAAVVGHDWGAYLAWWTAVIAPDRLTGVAGVSVPFMPRGPAPFLQLLRQHAPEDFYILWLVQPGVADAALAKDVRRTITTTRQWTAAWADQEDDQPPRPDFMSEDDLSVYVESFERTGFTGGLNWYRVLDRNWEVTEPYEDSRVDVPALFITGERDPVRKFMPAEAMRGWVTDLRRTVVIPGAGHWVQQQAPEPVTAALEQFLRELRW